MNTKQIISLLLAGQMLGAPLAQASSLSPFHSTNQGYPRVSLQTRRTVANAATPTPEESPDVTTAAPEATTVPAPEESHTDETTPTPAPTQEAEETTPTATPAPEATVAPTPIPTTTPEVTPTPSAVPTPEATVVPTPIPTATPEATPTPSAAPTPAATAVPTTQPTATPEAVPTPDAVPTPEATVVPTPAPTETPAPSARKLLNVAPQAANIDLAEELQKSKAWPFNTAYIGFGYEVYHADMPSGAADDYAVKEAGKYTVEDKGDVHYAEFAVEKPLAAAEEDPFMTTAEIERSAFFNNELSTTGTGGVGNGIYLNELSSKWGWKPREDGKYYTEDINLLRRLRIEVDGKRQRVTKCISLQDLADKWLGRIPDYQFDGWYVAAAEPQIFNGLRGYSSALPYVLWKDYNKYQFTYMAIRTPGDINNPNEANSRVVTRIPLSYYSGEDRADYPLSGPLDEAAMREIRDKTVVNFENYSPIYNANDKVFYPGTKWPAEMYPNSVGMDAVPKVSGINYNTESMEVELPIIAHWKLSDNATLVDNAPLNHEDPDKRTTVSTAVYSVKNGAVTTEDLLKNLYDKPFTDSTTAKTSFDYNSSNKYYLCVNADVEAIAPQLIAAEAFRTDEASADVGVSIRFRAAGEETYVDYVKPVEKTETEGTETAETESEETDAAADYKLSYTLLNGSREATVTDSAGKTVTGPAIFNNAKYPLRSQWTVAAQDGSGVLGTIPLTRAVGGDSDTDRYNEVEITVTAPDGVTRNVYTFYIQRLNDPYVVQNYGNTPYGMIARESDAGWETLAQNEGKTVDEVREIAYDRFAHGYVSTEPSAADGKPYSFNRYNYAPNSPSNVYFPRDSIENNASNYELNAVYDPRAWNGVDNVDLDKTAIVVYQDSSFLDPGFAVYDSEGRKVDFSEGSVKRSLILRTAASGLRMSELTDAGGQEGYYAGKAYGESGRMEATAADLWEEAFQTVKDADGKDRIDLRGLNVVPGVYTIEYRFTDAQRKFISGGQEQNFDSTAGTLFVDAENPGRVDTFTRTLVVLPLPGDVDMDGLVTVADAEVLRRELDSGTFLNSGSKVSSLFYYRVCDVNYDGVVDSDDVAELTEGYIPDFKRNVACDKYFYIPLYTGMSEAEEAAWHAGRLWDGSTTPESGKGALSLDYLGLHDETITDAAALAKISATVNGETVKADKDDIIWVGVRADLSGLLATDAAMKKGIAALKLSVIYDPTYLEPAVIPEVAAGDDRARQWRETLAAYNISGSAADDPNLWPATYELVESGCRTDVIYDEHYSRSTPAAVAPPEQRPRMLSVVLRNTAQGGSRTLAGAASDGSTGRYLLRLPFQVKYVDPNADYLQSLELSLSAQDMGMLAETPVQAVVWSGQTEPVFGGVSANLADELTYVGGSARKIPLADQNLTDAVELKNLLNVDGKAVYGEEFSFLDTAISMQDASKIKLPKGLTYDATLGRIEGRIEETGIFTFAVTNNVSSATYYINVGKAPLTLYAIPGERYYGEPNGEMDFAYDPADIQPVDLPGGANYVEADGFQNDGTSEQLAKLAGYLPPSVTTAVTQGENVGTYDINITSADSGSELKNYYFVYADATLDENGKPVMGTETKAAGKSPLRVQPRPLVIDRVTDAALHGVQVNVDTIQTVFRNTAATYQKDKDEAQQGFVPVVLGGNAGYPDYKDKLTGTAIYGEDEVTVTFTTRLQHETTTPPYYDLNGAPSKQVEATVEALALTETVTNANYKLMRLVDNKAHVTVTGNPIVSVDMTGWSNYSDYSSGDTINFNFMSVVVTYEKDNKTDSTLYMGDDAALDPEFGHVYLTWVTAEDKAKGESHYADPDHLLKNGQELLTNVHNGTYLCVTVLQGSEPISWFSDTAFEVLKKRITLTAKPLTVYYGEFKPEMLDYTYNVNDLSPTDLQALTEKLGHVPTGSSAELATPGVEGLANLVAPVLSAWSGERGTSEEASADTPVQWDNGAVKPSKIYIENAMDTDGKTILSGASEYRFVFTGAPAGQTSKYGVSDLNILPRPIMVDTVTMGEGSKAFLYDDTADWILRQMYYTENGTPVAHPVTLTGLNTATATAEADTFVAGAYNFRQEQGRDCYYLPGSTSPVALEAPTPTGDAIHVNKDGQLDNVVITYVATYQRDVVNAVPPETPYFTLNGAARKTVPVTVNGLDLPKNLGDNSNYKLVYRLLRLASTTSPENGQTTGLVKLREMKKMEVSADAAKRVYTYGEMLDLSGMALHVTYESEGDNNLSRNMARNVIERTSYYSDTGDGSDSFANQGLQVYWKLDPGLTISDNTIEDSALSDLLAQGKLASTDVDGLGRYPDVAKTGKTLFVCGRRFDGDGTDSAHKLVWAEGSLDFTVRKKSLSLAVGAKNRYYGEPNRDYQAYYALSDLSLPDQKRLTAAGYTPDFTANGTDYFFVTAQPDREDGGREVSQDIVCDLDFTDGVNDELAWLNRDYLAPGTQTVLGVRFTSDGLRSSGVGSYTIGMEQTASGNMANYTFGSHTTAALRVFRRPIVVEKVLEKMPTIYYNTRETEFPALVAQSVPDTAFRTGLPTLTGGCYDNSAKDGEIQAAVNAGMTAAMPLSGDAIYGNDALSLQMTVVYPAYADRESFPAGQYQVDQPVTVKDLQIVDDCARNYFLVYRSANDEFERQPADPAAVGQLDKRPINAIQVLELPKLEYTYGETMNLSRLKLKVTYGVIAGETYPETDDLFYSQMTGRLSVNYWESEPQADGSLAPRPLPTSKADYGIGLKNRPARMGDHLTIAPAHDAGTIAGESPDFAHNGKYLILTARADEDMNYDAPPVLVNDVGQPVPVTVKPLDLTYTLTAEDRTYNDKDFATRTATAGSITLTNVYAATKINAAAGQTEYVNDRDLVYVAADKSFDREELSRYVNDADKTSAEAYVFTVDGADQTDRIAFDFYDENVMYYEGEYTEETPVAPEDWAGYWNSGLAQRTAKRPADADWNSYGAVAPMPVLVSGMRLLGPDAANYTLDKWVGSKDDVAAIFDAETADPAKDQVPYAVMHKATQSISAAERPRLSVDARSNAVRLTYETALDAVRPDLADLAPDEFQSEYHYQYGLEYQAPAEDAAAMEQWGDWSDHSYFGGEKLTVTNDPSYVPSEPEEEPEEDAVAKGQLYPWEAEDVDAVTGKSLFGTREPLARNTVYWGMVRLAETHNYLSSAPVRAYLEDVEDPAVAEAAAAEQRAEALKTSEEMSQTVLAWLDDTKLEEHPELQIGPAPAVKTYAQSFEIISTEQLKGADSEEYDIATLEAVWFSDIQQFAKVEELSAVLRNLAKPRYYSFYWDKGKTAAVEFGADGLDLSQPEIFVEMSEKAPDGSTTRVTRQVNLGDDPERAPRPYSAVLYATVRSSGSNDNIPSGISIGGGTVVADETGESLNYVLASPPETLKVTFRPASVVAEGITWTTSDPRVVLVDENGRMTFVGVGTAVITATTRRSHRTATVTITVTPPEDVKDVGAAWAAVLELEDGEKNRFEFYKTDAFMRVDEENLFHPEWLLTRSELVLVLSRFYRADRDWKWSGKSTFPDISGREAYAQVTELLYDGGIITGMPDGKFYAGRTATRAEVVTILCRMMGLSPGPADGASRFFTDCGANYAWANGCIDALAEAGVVKGMGDSTFEPEREITRAELAAMLSRILLTGNYCDGGPRIVPIDVPADHWAHEVVLRAVNAVDPRTK